MALNDISETGTSNLNSIVFSAITNDVNAADQAYQRYLIFTLIINLLLINIFTYLQYFFTE